MEEYIQREVKGNINKRFLGRYIPFSSGEGQGNNNFSRAGESGDTDAGGVGG